jgi:glutamate synthase (ferredoxin)
MEEPEMEQNSFDIPHDFFKKVCDFTIPETSSMQWEWFFTKENQADCKTTLKLLFAIKI